MAEAKYEPDESGRLWWCNSHQRRATSILTFPDGRTKHCCAPGQGGNLLPCQAIDLTEDIEIMEQALS